jgi:hypothetical protein
MGRYDSSRTRVQPVFNQLLKMDPSGRQWTGKLFSSVLHKSPTANRLSSKIGILSSSAKNRFEIKFPPPERFLKWLLENPGHLSWPTQKGGPKRFGMNTQLWREKLVGKHGMAAQAEAQREALNHLERLGAVGSLREWWAFEGFTTVDCVLETDEALLFIEGKRKDTLSPSTEWFVGRNQLFRNLETCGEAARGKEFGVLLIAETDPLLDLTKQMAEKGLPHLQDNERSDLIDRFLGVVLWRELCEVTGVDFQKLPDWVP